MPHVQTGSLHSKVQIFLGCLMVDKVVRDGAAKLNSNIPAPLDGEIVVIEHALAEATPPVEAKAALKSEFWAIMLVLTAALGFSAKAIFIKLAYAAAPDLTPITLLSLRMLFAAPGFLLIAWWSSRGAKKLTQREWGAVITLGLLGYYASSLFDFIGLQTVSASLERLILFLSPTIVIVISAVFLKRKITRNDVVALAVTYAGLAIVVTHDATANTSTTTLVGCLFVFASAISYSIYLVGGGQVMKTIGATRFAAYASLVSTVGIFIHFLLFNKLQILAQPPRVLALSGWMAAISTVFPVIMIAIGIGRIGAPRAALLGVVGPVGTIGLGYLFLNEPVTLLQLFGSALVIGGVVLVSLAKKT
jgi:drug/metabolite transporter (DMT)-like permease